LPTRKVLQATSATEVTSSPRAIDALFRNTLKPT
jgi:hypothetical protein